jgi:hypothetical protein
VLVFIPKVEAFSMEQIVFEVSEKVLILRKNLKPKPVSSSIFEVSKVEVTLYIDTWILRD